MKAMSWILLAVLATAVMACGDEGGTAQECTPGNFIKCDDTCAAKIQTCDANGVYGVCQAPASETACADGKDDDCDGLIDAADTVDCTLGCVPGTVDSTCTLNNPPGCAGSRTCQPNATWGACVAAASETVCGDGKDNDCDTKIDTADPDCGQCTAGVTENCTISIPAGCVGAACSCLAAGTRTCQATKAWGACTTTVVEDCNKKDDDCDGQVDEDIAQQNCTNQCGPGKQLCTNGQWTVCDAPLPQVEVCDAKDNDCDGKVDTGVDGNPLTQKCNACNTGVQNCVAGQWSACPAPPAEVCDKLDNDCDGQVDNVAGGCNCTVGQKQDCGTDTGECSKGEQTCNAGQWSECGGEKFKGSSPELCDGLDNDCNGVVDEGDPEGGKACGTPNKIDDPSSQYYTPCKIGVEKCKGGQLQCIGGIDPTPELCDEIDNDCNGSIDDKISGDQYEKNNTCAAAEDLGYVIENQGKSTFKATMFPDSDIDWYVITADELNGFCFPWDAEGPYQLTVKLSNIPEGADYDLCVWPETTNDCGDLPDEGVCEELGIWKGDNDPETYTYQWDGQCASSDAVVFYVKVVPYGFNPDLDCQPYQLDFEVKSL